MKTKLFLLLAVCTLTFQSCSKSDENSEEEIATSAFAGKWSGTYMGDETGTWTLEVFAPGSIQGDAVSNIGLTNPFNGSVSASGKMLVNHTDGTVTVGQMTEATVSGTWTSGGNSGTISGKKD